MTLKGTEISRSIDSTGSRTVDKGAAEQIAAMERRGKSAAFTGITGILLEAAGGGASRSFREGIGGQAVLHFRGHPGPRIHILLGEDREADHADVAVLAAGQVGVGTGDG